MDSTYWPKWLKKAWLAPRGAAGSLQRVDDSAPLPDELEIVTLEGNHRVSWGDYIIQGVQGELYPCKPDIFEQTYEAVEPTYPKWGDIKNSGDATQAAKPVFLASSQNQKQLKKSGLKFDLRG